MSCSFAFRAPAHLQGLAWLALFFGLIEQATVAQPSNLVAAYAFDEGGGNIVADLSGHGNGGTIDGAFWTVGRFGTALEFDGNGGWVTVNDSASLDLTTGMTLEAWVYPTANDGGWQDVIYKGSVDIYYLEGSSGAGAGVPATGGTFSSSPLFGPSALPVNTWSHLAGTYDGSVLRLLVNGVEVASRAQPGTIDTSTGPLTIGGDAAYGQFWAGRIDEVRIYNRALSAGEIQRDMITPVTGVTTDPLPPTISITSPASGSAVSHVLPVAATAADNLAVIRVEFFVDGTSVGGAVAEPYTISWNTTTVSNGEHSLTAVARDPGGNQTTSAPVVLTVTNPAFVNEVVVPGIVSATTLCFLPDGRMLVGELTETIWVVQPGANSADPVPFLQLDSSDLFGEQGLMDITLDPNFVTNGYYYVFYTRGFPSQNNFDRVSRFTASDNGTLPGSEFVLWQDDVAVAGDHHGGSIAFGPDGKLYVSVGDQFISDDAQRLDSYHGKILRLNADGSVPADNPFVDGPGPNRDEIWALGLRNPFRLSFDQVTGRMYIADVGGNDPATAFEEVNLGLRGANYGWPRCEGKCNAPGVTDPLFSYPHVGRDASITGGFVYRGSQFPSGYYGSYFFADYAQNWIKRLTFDASGNLDGVVDFEPPDGSADGPHGDAVKLVEGPDGSLYYVDIGFNDQHVPNPAAIRRIRYVLGDLPPESVARATPTSGLPPLEVTFSSAGSFDPEGASISFYWAFGDGTSSTEANPIHVYQTAGAYVARLTVSDGRSSTLSSELSITVGTPPTPAIASPQEGDFFRAGDVVAYGGTATDLEDGELPARAFSWTILFHHDGHVHPAGGPFTNTTTGTLVIPSSGHDFSGATSYEIILTVTDSNGLKGATSVTIFPEKVHLSFDTVPSGLAVELSGIRKVTPFVEDALINFQYAINAPPQSQNGTAYEFVSWSDGGRQTHSVVVSETGQSLIASYGPRVTLPLVIETAGWLTNAFKLTFRSVAGRRYRVEYSPTLPAGAWTTVADQVPGTGEPVAVVDASAGSDAQRFYRVLQLP